MFVSATDDTTDLIAKSGRTIYDPLGDRPDLLLSKEMLQTILQTKLADLLLDQPIRTRSKVVKSAICKALGYPVPKSFRKTKPRFPGQDFDVYVQKSDNLQIWNEELSAARRYVLVRVDEKNRVVAVRVITGAQLSKLDTTGTLTKKYQATAISKVDHSRLVSVNDTPNLMLLMEQEKLPVYLNLLPADRLYVKLKPLLGRTINNAGNDQERNRGWALHQIVSKQLGLDKAEDDGQIPDVAEQLLELKLQTRRTVDLGLVRPGDHGNVADFPGLQLADIRYGLFYGTIEGEKIRLDHLILVNGADFFCFYRSMQGKVVNTKNQIRLPKGFFERG